MRGKHTKDDELVRYFLGAGCKEIIDNPTVGRCFQ